MLAMTPDYDQLPLIGKVEVFEHALANTTGQDLNKVLWLKSQNSEDWLQATVCPKSAYKARVSKVSI
jgi:FKBP12-rapamycin complex-associated protein